jgi:hypothetical protein
MFELYRWVYSVERIGHYNDRMYKILMLDSEYRGKTIFLKQTNTLKCLISNVLCTILLNYLKQVPFSD